MHGRKMGTHGHGARKKKKGKGHRGGKGMSGTGKRGDQKKTKVIKLYGHGYFGKKGITSKATRKDKKKKLNIGEIQGNLGKYGKKSGDKWEINLENHKILGQGEVKDKLIIRAQGASKSAQKKAKATGGEIIFNKMIKKEKVKNGIRKNI
jgi:large subunit ribosomal protein L15